MHGLNRILGKQSHLRVLRVLHESDQPLSGREVQRRCGLSNRAVMTALEELTALHVVHCAVESSTYAFELNQKNFFVRKSLKPALQGEQAFWADLCTTVRRLARPKPEAAVVTGPLTRDETLSSGVVELHHLFTNGRDRLRAYRNFDRLREQIQDRYALELTSTFMDLRTMDAPEFKPIWSRIAREGVLLFGKLP